MTTPRTQAAAPAASSESGFWSGVGTVFGEVRDAFTGGISNVRNGDFRKMDWKQWLAVGATGIAVAFVAKAVFEMMVDFMRENWLVSLLVGAALLAVAIFSFMGGSKGQTAAAAPRPDPARQPVRRPGVIGPTSSLDEELGLGIDPEVRRLAMSEVGSTQLAMLDPQMAATLNLDAVRLSDDLPRAQREGDVAAEARKQRDTLAMFG